MTNDIEPALSAEEWESVRHGTLRELSTEGVAATLSELCAEAIRGERADRAGDNAGFSAIDPDLARQIADALESYLPPEER
jgi:hypothetical protein